MTPKKLHTILAGLTALAFLVSALGAYGAYNLLQNKSRDVSAAKLEVEILERKQTQLIKAASDIKRYQLLAETARSIVPKDKDQAETVRQIVKIAGENNIKFGSINFPSSTLGDKKSDAEFSQLKEVKGIPGVFSLEIVAESEDSSPISFADLIKFLDALEHNRRTALVSGIAIQPDPDNPDKLSFSLAINEYIKP